MRLSCQQSQQLLVARPSSWQSQQLLVARPSLRSTAMPCFAWTRAWWLGWLLSLRSWMPPLALGLLAADRWQRKALRRRCAIILSRKTRWRRRAWRLRVLASLGNSWTASGTNSPCFACSAKGPTHSRPCNQWWTTCWRLEADAYVSRGTLGTTRHP